MYAHAVFFPFPIAYFYSSFETIYDKLDNEWYYSVKQSIALLEQWECHGYQSEYISYILPLFDYRTEFKKEEIING